MREHRPAPTLATPDAAAGFTKLDLKENAVKLRRCYKF